MFVRNKKNASGSVSIQIIEKTKNSNRVVKTVGCSKNKEELVRLERKAKKEIQKLKRQLSLFNSTVVDLETITQARVKVIGPELALGKIFDAIGLNLIKEELFRHLVIARIAYPGSKLKTVDYLKDYLGIQTQVQKIYRLMDKINKEHKEEILQIIFNHTKKTLGEKISVIFYDITTLHYEAADEDDLRKLGYSKSGKFNHPQILLALIVGAKGYPLAYAVFEGNKFEGHTLLPVLEEIKQRYSLPQATIVADSAMLSKKNLELLEKEDYKYIIGARIRNEKGTIKKQILKHNFEDGSLLDIKKESTRRLIVSYSEKRSKKDTHNRKKGLRKLKERIVSGKLTKKQINNRGYNKFLKMEGEIDISIDEEKIIKDEEWDGLKGYLTNSNLPCEQIIEDYSHLWQIEKAFRISKTDLLIRPVHHHKRERIEAHICIAFAAYSVYKELERILADKNLAPQKAVESLRTIYEVSLFHPDLSNEYILRTHLNQTQKTILNIFG